MDTPRKTKLYHELAKDFSPKRADMMICRYIEMLEERIGALETCCKALEQLIERIQLPDSKGGSKGVSGSRKKEEKGEA